MKAFVSLCLIAAWLGFSGPGALAESGSAPALKAADTSTPAKTDSYPGKDIAQTISLVTGVAISPLLGASAVGAWKYFEAKTPAQRARLPWFAQPWFFVPALLLVTACFIKDTAGVAIPTALKKPLDVADTIENKISGLVATGAFVPLIVPLMHSVGPQSSLSDLGMAAIDFSWLYNLIMVPISMAAFVIVFMASNAINILILLSPFTTVDTALKSFRLLVLSTVTATAFANPWVGAAWALVIILISYLIAGWSFRLSHFGMSFIWDFLTFRRTRFQPEPDGNKVFLARKTGAAPARSYGRLCRNGESLVLRYRPWLVLPERTQPLPAGTYAVGKGLFYSEISRVEGDQMKSTVLLPPRYRDHEEKVAQIYGLRGVEDVGLRAAFKWLGQTLGLSSPGKPQIPETVPA